MVKLHPNKDGAPTNIVSLKVFQAKQKKLGTVRKESLPGSHFGSKPGRKVDSPSSLSSSYEM